MTVLEGPWPAEAPEIVDEAALLSMLTRAACPVTDTAALWCTVCGEVHAVEVLDG